MGVFADTVRRLTSDPGARWLAGITDELDAKLKTLQQQLDDCCGDGSLRLRDAFSALEGQHAELAKAHKTLEAKYADLVAAYKTLEAKYAETTPQPAPPQPSPDTPQ